MPINPLILDKINNLDVPNSMKNVLNKVLEIEEDLESIGEQKNFKKSINKFLENFADEEEIQRFCENYE